MDTQWTIGKVAKIAEVNIQTVRYYERRGLVSPDAHKDSGYRLYGPEAAQKIRFIKNAQDLGFTLKEIAGLLRLRVSHRARCGDVKKKAGVKLQNVREKILSLKALEKTLLDLIRTCRSQATTNACPILKSLELNKKRNNSKGVKRR